MKSRKIFDDFQMTDIYTYSKNKGKTFIEITQYNDDGFLIVKIFKKGRLKDYFIDGYEEHYFYNKRNQVIRLETPDYTRHYVYSKAGKLLQFYETGGDLNLVVDCED